LEKGNLAGNSILRMSTQLSFNTFSNKLRGGRVKRRIEVESEGIKEVKELGRRAVEAGLGVLGADGA